MQRGVSGWLTSLAPHRGCDVKVAGPLRPRDAKAAAVLWEPHNIPHHYSILIPTKSTVPSWHTDEDKIVDLFDEYWYERVYKCVCVHKKQERGAKVFAFV